MLHSLGVGDFDLKLKGELGLGNTLAGVVLATWASLELVDIAKRCRLTGLELEIEFGEGSACGTDGGVPSNCRELSTHADKRCSRFWVCWNCGVCRFIFLAAGILSKLLGGLSDELLRNLVVSILVSILSVQLAKLPHPGDVNEQLSIFSSLSSFIFLLKLPLSKFELSEHGLGLFCPIKNGLFNKLLFCKTLKEDVSNNEGGFKHGEGVFRSL